MTFTEALEKLFGQAKAQQLEALFTIAIKDEWGTEEQINAQNRFGEALEEMFPDIFGEGSDFMQWCNKATSDEILEEEKRLIIEIANR